MSFFRSIAFVEAVSNWTGFAVVLFTVLAGLTGVLHWYFSRELTAQKEAALQRFQASSQTAIAAANERAAAADERAAEANVKAASLNERAAKAELAMAEAHLKLEEVRKRQAPRTLNYPPGKFSKLLTGTGWSQIEMMPNGWRSPIGENDSSTNHVQARVYYQPDDEEAFAFADGLRRLLDSEAGWDVPPARPFPQDEGGAAPAFFFEGADEDIPAMTRLSGRPMTGVTILAGKPTYTGSDSINPPEMLAHALRAFGHQVNLILEPDLAPEVAQTIRIFIGRKP